MWASARNPLGQDHSDEDQSIEAAGLGKDDLVENSVRRRTALLTGRSPAPAAI